MKQLIKSLAAPMAHGLRMVANLIILKMIAATLGPVGMGTLGNLMSLITMVSIFSGGGISIGITKYVAQYKSNPRRLFEFISSALTYGLIYSLMLIFVVFLFASRLSLMIFDSEDLYYLLMAFGVMQVLYFLGGTVVSVVNGFNRQDIFAIITLSGYAITIPVAIALILSEGLSGAAIALLVVSSANALPAFYFAIRSRIMKNIRLKIIKDDVNKLFKYSSMALISALVFPMVEIYIRKLIIELLGQSDAGMWQAMTRFSAAYLGLFTLYLSTTYMPRLSELNDRGMLLKIIFENLRIISLIFIIFAIFILYFREMLVAIIYSAEFVDVVDMMIWYLIGDFFRVNAYVIGFLGVAKAATRFYVMCELLQAGLLIIFSYLILSGGGTLINLAQAYAIVYFIYFVVMFSIFWLYKQGKYDICC